MRSLLRLRPLLRSRYATLSPHTPPPQSPYEVFDEPAKARQRDRAILRSNSGVVDYLREEIAERLSERVEDLKTAPSSILEIASHAGQLTRILQETIGNDAQGADRKWLMLEQSQKALHRDEMQYPVTRINASPSDFLGHPDIEAVREKLEAVVTASGLHWTGDIVGHILLVAGSSLSPPSLSFLLRPIIIPLLSVANLPPRFSSIGCLTQIRHVLKPDGVFVGAILGGDTLFELRTSLQLAEQERRGGIANRISPMINPTDAPSLMNRAGFTLTTVDVEDITFHYPSVWELMSDLRDMGESNAILGRRALISRDVLLATDAIYRELHGDENGLPALFQIIFVIGWKPGPNQPKPLERGSAQTNLKDIL